MIAKIIWPLLFLIGFINFSVSNTIDRPISKTFAELHHEAMDACMINSTMSLIEYSKGMECRSAIECICPQVCYVQKLGIVNDGGLNKIAVNWIRTFMDHLNTNIDLEAMQIPYWASNKSIESMLYGSPKVVHQLSDACLSKNETEFEIVANEVRSSFEEQGKKENPAVFIPSEEDSPILELIRDATNICSTKFNTSSFAIVMDMIKERRGPVPPKKSMCYMHCMLSELDFMDKKGLKEPWDGFIADISPEFPTKPEFLLAAINEAVISVNTKCTTEFDELSDKFFGVVFKDLETKVNKHVREMRIKKSEMNE